MVSAFAVLLFSIARKRLRTMNSSATTFWFDGQQPSVIGVGADIAAMTMLSSNSVRAGWQLKSVNNRPKAWSKGIFCRYALDQTRMAKTVN